MICTTIEQSKRLLKIGIKPDTADMWWHPDWSKYPDCVRRCGVENIPAWSLSALLELMPIEIQTETNYFTLMQITRERNGVYNISYEPFLINDMPLILFASESLIDAAVEMLEWIYKNGYLGKETEK